VPVITITGLQLGSVIAFAIITETVFQWPGMGLMFIQAVTFADIPVMAAYLVLVGFFFVVINLVVDLLYYVVDPRLQIGREAAAGTIRSAPTTRAATCYRRSSTVPGCRLSSASRRSCWRCCSGSALASSPAGAAASPRRSSCASPTYS